MIKKIFLSVLLCTVCMFAMAQSQTVTHVVQRGETIESIAEFYKVSVEDINKANPNVDGIVYVGMKLNIPTNSNPNHVTKEKRQSVKEVTNHNVKFQNTDSYIAKENGENMSNHRTTSNSSLEYGEGSSFSFLYQSDAKLYGLQMEMGTNLFCLTASIISNLKFGGKETSASTAWMGAGVRRKLVIADNFLIQGKLYPYIGLGQSNTPKNIEIGQEAEDKTKFTYGASADVSVGLKLWNTAKGNSTFLHVGYAIMASEFETKGMFKGGCIMVGLTTIIK